MTCSPARLAANLANSKRSTGPRTAAGKLASSKNAYKHGMTGDGVALPPAEAAEVDSLAARLTAEMAPSGEMGRILIRRIALLSARLDKCGRHDAAMTARRVRDAQKQRDDARYAEVDAIAANLTNDPDITVRRLMRTPEGIDGLIEFWQLLRGRLVLPDRFNWTDKDEREVVNLLGRRPGQHPPTPFDPLLRAIRGNFSELRDDQGAGLTRKQRKLWAREQLARLIDDEVEALRELRVLIDDEGEAADRAEAGDRALFDPSKEGQLARRYEAAAERGLFRALREFHEVERRAATTAPATPEPEPPSQPVPARPRPRVAAPAVALAPVAPPIAPATPRHEMPSQTKPIHGPGPAPMGGPG